MRNLYCFYPSVPQRAIKCSTFRWVLFILYKWVICLIFWSVCPLQNTLTGWVSNKHRLYHMNYDSYTVWWRSETNAREFLDECCYKIRRQLTGKENPQKSKWTSRVQQTTITPLAMEHTLLWSHLLCKEFSEFFATRANHYNSPGTHHFWVDSDSRD